MSTFEDDHYVPVLRWKRGERDGLRLLAGNVRRQVTPLLELVPIADNTPNKLANEIKKSWALDPFFLDFVHLPDLKASNIIADVSHALRIQGMRPILVTGVTRESDYQSAIANAVRSDKNGACIRLSPSDLKNDWLKIYIGDVLQGLGLEPERVDLVADYQLISEFAMSFQELCKKVPHLTRWRTFTVMSGAFSKDLTEYKKNEHAKIGHSFVLMRTLN
jgi:hypothetical protein